MKRLTLEGKEPTLGFRDLELGLEQHQGLARPKLGFARSREEEVQGRIRQRQGLGQQRRGSLGFRQARARQRQILARVQSKRIKVKGSLGLGLARAKGYQGFYTRNQPRRIARASQERRREKQNFRQVSSRENRSTRNQLYQKLFKTMEGSHLIRRQTKT